MISFSLMASKNEPFRVRYQRRSEDGNWVDIEVSDEVGRSPIYEINKDLFRVVIEDILGASCNAKNA